MTSKNTYSDPVTGAIDERDRRLAALEVKNAALKRELEKSRERYAAYKEETGAQISRLVARVQELEDKDSPGWWPFGGDK